MSKSKILFCGICLLAFIVMLKDRIELPLLFILGSIVFLCLAVLYLRDHPQATYKMKLPLAGTGLVLLVAGALLVFLPNSSQQPEPGRQNLPRTAGQENPDSPPANITFIRNCLIPD